ncbi:hypothetical protein LR48_Vigan10g069200 [Vigna angularis]|uniref:Uncharacterized protein n=2 Tax=Phaseolus angularis TaxID=3914 RepID=A0A0L9VIA7_PHAAN|nr:uncharacterized protein LOC128197399 [Vigna angularis]KOM54800.1 hypothetical protein LR48_Vigan10g069200 [Vigna angularis]BAT88710.1 hypothetical protein VIGAN_05229200 [Vigna angularis var. angularis]
MWRLLSVVTRKLQNTKKSSSRVADENMFEAAANGGRREHGWSGISLIYGILHAPISILSCVSHPEANGSDGVWVSGEFVQISEMNHLMVNDSMRYAILM